MLQDAVMLPRLLLVLSVMSAPSRVAFPAELRTLPQDLHYCQELASRLASLPAGVQEPARGLGEEGELLCQAGHIRTGIARLRRALRVAQGR
jgi:hypothetical protein